MTVKVRAPKFHRETPAVRREALVEATLRSLREHGHEGTSIRRISATAGVSIGLINHHFRSKSELVAAAYESLALSLQVSTRAAAEQPGQRARARLSGFFRASFSPEILDPSVFSIWLVFWSMVLHAPEMRAVHDRTYREYRATLESLLAALASEGAAPPFKVRNAAIGLAALLDGLWVELSLSPGTFTAEDAISLCEDWVSALCRATLPGLVLNPGAAPESVHAGTSERPRTSANTGPPAHD